MSLYSTTRVQDITRRSLNPRTRNICIEYKLFTVRDIWNYYQSHYSFDRLSGVGRKGNKQLTRICTKVADMMRAEAAVKRSVITPVAAIASPAAVAAPAPAVPPAAPAPAPAPLFLPAKNFSIVTFFHSLDASAKKVAESFYNRYVQQLRWTGQQTLDALCKGLTLEALINSLSAKPSRFQPYYETTRGRNSEIGKMLQAIKSFYASETFALCVQNPPLTLLRLQMNALLATDSISMDGFLTLHFDKLESGEFPLGAFIDAVINANTVLHSGTRHVLHSACFSCAAGTLISSEQVARNMRVGQEKMWRMLEEKEVFRLVRSAVALLQNYGFTIPPRYILPETPFHVCEGIPGINPRSFGDLFILKLFNPAYLVFQYKVKQSTASMLIEPWLPEQFDITLFLTAINRLQSECITEAYTIDLIEFMAPYYKTNLFPEGQKRLYHTMVSLILQAYNLAASDDGELELKRTSKIQTWEHLYDIIKERNRPCNTGDLQDALEKLDVHVSLQTIRQNVYQRDEIFKIFYPGGYGLQEWQSDYSFIRRATQAMTIVE